MLYDALIVVSFGGPEKPQDVIPFLENVLRGRNVPHQRMLEVAQHYYHFGGRSPINDQNRELISALRKKIDLPVYWGNRNWHPLLTDTLRRMKKEGVRRALAFVTSAFSSYSGCRQYREDIARALAEINAETAPEIAGANRESPLVIHKLRTFSNHPLFVETLADRTRAVLCELPEDRRKNAALVFTAHSIPAVMAESSGYQRQLWQTASLVAQCVGYNDWTLAFQSRSGPPGQPWLEPDIGDWLRRERPKNIVIVPVGFISDHMEVVYDLDTEVARLCNELDIHMVRARTAGTHPKFIDMIDELIRERTHPGTPRRWLGELGASPDECAEKCCVWARNPHS